MSKKTPLERSICVYVAEPQENGVSERVIELIVCCVQDKIFSGNEDVLAIIRDDQMTNINFRPVSWKLLQDAENDFKAKRNVNLNSDEKFNIVSNLLTLLESIDVQAMEDSYQEKTVLYFANLLTPVDDYSKLIKRAKEGCFFVTIIIPDKNEMNENQLEQAELLQKSLKDASEFFSVHNLKAARKLLFNTLSKKPKKSNPWNIQLTIGSEIFISVQAFIQTRKNVQSELRTALEKNVSHLGKLVTTNFNVQKKSNSPGTSNSNGNLAILPISPQNTAKSEEIKNESSPAEYVLAKDAIVKEKILVQEDGEIVDKEETIFAYYYGDRLVPFDQTEQNFSYKTGDKCLEVLVFTPKEVIWPCYMLGNGTDVIVANSKEPDSVIKLSALVKALHNLNRVAIVRKVRTQNSRLQLGVLSPNVDKNCLIFTEICFQDDISIPHFPSLIKENDENSEGEGLTAQESAIDNLILSMSIHEFSPIEGPVDPNIQTLRRAISSKILGKDLTNPFKNSQKESGSSANNSINSYKNRGLSSEDNIDIYFEEIVAKDEIINEIKELFPLKEIPVKKWERPSGAQIFKKRENEEEILAIEDAKKPKIEEKMEICVEGVEDEGLDDEEDLLNQL